MMSKPRHIQPSPTTVHDKLQTSISFPLPEMPHTSTQAQGSKEPNRSLERLPDSRLKKEVEVDLVPSVLYKVEHRIPSQSAVAVPSRQPMESTPQAVIPSGSTDQALPLSNSDPELARKVTHPMIQQGSNTQITAETNPSYLQLHTWGPAIVSGNNLDYEAHPKMGTHAAQVLLGKPELNTAMQGLKSASLNETGNQAVATAMVSKTSKVEAATQPQNEVSVRTLVSS